MATSEKVSYSHKSYVAWNRRSALEKRVSDVEKLNARLEGAALTTAWALEEISQHWDAMRRCGASRNPS